ncbi:Cof-type HAD-IIB family hydrolase [Paenibacillus motobuensis]|uniref:Phosphoglycolate phosphatase n=1 Tax=Paenibacillus motobuensis TaxID=295324 RepID=A0ABN0YI46_9BACL
MKYKLLALDMDGTLLTDEHQISPDTEKWLRKAMAAGVHVCLSTGRRFVDAVPFGEQLGLDTPMVTVNGSEVWRSPHELYHREQLDQSVVKRMYQMSRDHHVWFWADAVEGTYNEKNWRTELLEQNQWLKFGYYTEDDDLRHSLMVELQNIGGLEITNSSPYNLEINPAGINKASGVRTICELLGINMEEVAAFGDSLNDLAVIQAAGLGVAMGNAQLAVQEQADVVTASNNDDGIAIIIRDYILA